ncbi:hypothetical protein BT69DRAFT_1281088 [Atractiella rhizophila]|nr:hypothetical protein BT69DRAFT_1281088 [Atractiella rhizophila]
MSMFSSLKASALSSLQQEHDKSPKNSVDERFVPLIDTLNSSPSYFTTSSCSGRLVLSTHSNQKGKGFAFVSHDIIADASSLAQHLPSYDHEEEEVENVDLRYDPPVVHLTADCMTSALKILHASISKAGWKDSGLIPSLSFSHDKPVRIALRLAPRHLDIPLIIDGKWMIREDVMDRLVEEGNRRLKEGWDRIQRLQTALEGGEMEEWEDEGARRERKRKEGLVIAGQASKSKKNDEDVDFDSNLFDA